MRLDRDQLLAAPLRFGARAEESRLRRAIDVGVDQTDLAPRLGNGDREVRRDGRFANAALAAADRNQGARGLSRSHRNARLADAGQLQRGSLDLGLDPLALSGIDTG